jgi:hypothetical protein
VDVAHRQVAQAVSARSTRPELVIAAAVRSKGANPVRLRKGPNRAVPT